MKIALDISPISKTSTSAHKVRGVGSYINLLVENLSKYDKKNEYVFVEDKKFPADADLIHYPYFDPFFLTLPFRSNMGPSSAWGAARAVSVTPGCEELHDFQRSAQRARFGVGFSRRRSGTSTATSVGRSRR